MPDTDGTVALISDVHGNLEALRAVIDDIRAQGIETIINLGDTVGYGPDPEACIDLVQEHCTINLCGNHDFAIFHGADGFNPVARAAVEFARARLRPDPDNPDPESRRRWTFLESLEPVYENSLFQAMHGSPREPVNEYILPSDPDMDPYKIDRIFEALRREFGFVGHTHFPGVVEEDRPHFLMTTDFPDGFPLPDSSGGHAARRAIVNVGSVGQPRDQDVRSCYVILSEDRVAWRRVAYDVEETIRKIRASEGLHEICGERLKEGR
jgi:diadenosine tetraphosphatase ApaH/serine/threonine PP2A family protein phosphatase